MDWIEAALGMAIGAFFGSMIAGRAAIVIYQKKLDRMKRHIREVEGYYHEYRMANYKNAVRLEIVRRLVVEPQGTDSPYRGVPPKDVVEETDRICREHGIRVAGPFPDPFEAAEAFNVGGTTVFPMREAPLEGSVVEHWAVTELEDR